MREHETETLNDCARTAKIDTSQLTLIGQGNESLVYGGYVSEDGKHMVVKVPKDRLSKSTPTADEIASDYQLAHSAFNQPEDPHLYIPDTRLQRYPDGSYHVLQEEVQNARSITKADLQDPTIEGQITQIFARNENLARQQGRSLPYLGREGAMKMLMGSPLMTNLLIEESDEEKRIRITDLSLLDLSKARDRLSYRANAFASRRMTKEAPPREATRKTLLYAKL